MSKKNKNSKLNMKTLTQKKSVNPYRGSSKNDLYDDLDGIINHEGNSLSLEDYNEIMKDIQVNVGLDTIMSFLLSKDFILTSASDDPEDIKIAEFINNMLDNLNTPFREVRKNIYTALIYGFSIQEKIYRKDKNSLIILDDLYPLHIETLQKDPFVYDKKGNLKKIHQESEYGKVNLDLDKVFIYSYKSYFNDYKGKSILNELFNLVKIKRKVLEWLILYLHKHENPAMYAKIRDPKFKEDMINLMDGVSEGRTNMVIGEADTIGVLETQHRGETFFTTLNYFDTLIFRRMYIGDLLFGGGNNGAGSYAQSRTQLELTTRVLFNGIHEDIAMYIQRLIINPLVAWNFGEDKKVPLFSFVSFNDKDIIGLLNALAPYTRDGFINPNEAWFMEAVGALLQQMTDVKVDRVKHSTRVKNKPNNVNVNESDVNVNELSNEDDDNIPKKYD